MCLFNRKKYKKNVERDNKFLKSHATLCNTLLRYAERSENVKDELLKLQEGFQYTVAADDSAAKKIEKKIETEFEELKALLRQPDWDEAQVLLLIRDILGELDEIASLR